MHYYMTRELLPALILYSMMFFALCVVAVAGFSLWYAARQIFRMVLRPIVPNRLGYAQSGGNPQASVRGSRS
jgi:hypothetical protein